MAKSKHSGSGASKAGHAKSAPPSANLANKGTPRIHGVKDGRVTKPNQTHQAKIKETAKVAVAKAQEKGHKKRASKKEPTPESESESESDDDSDDSGSASDSSESESEVEHTRPSKTNGVTKAPVNAAAVEDDDDSDSEDDSEIESGTEQATPAKTNGVAKASRDKEVDEDEDDDSDSDSDSDVASPDVQKASTSKTKVATVNATPNGKPAKELDSDSSSSEDDSEDEADVNAKGSSNVKSAVNGGKHAKDEVCPQSLNFEISILTIFRTRMTMTILRTRRMTKEIPMSQMNPKMKWRTKLSLPRSVKLNQLLRLPPKRPEPTHLTEMLRDPRTFSSEA